MSVNKLGIILFSSFLLFATAPLSPAQSTNQETTKKQTTTQKSTTTKDAGKATTAETQSTQSTEKSTKAKSAQTGKSTPATSDEKKTGTKKASGKKTSAISKDKVRQTQSALKQQGFDPGPIDGIMGPMTMTALRNYQSHNGLEVTGNLNAETENSLTGTAAASSSTSRNQNQPYSSTRESLGLTSEGTVSNVEDIRQVQQALADLMYNPGEANGMMSSQTRQAIREFQWLNNLPVTGNVDEQTKIAINTQWGGGLESAQLGKTTYSSTSVEREKPAVTPEPQPATPVESEKPAVAPEPQPTPEAGIPAEEQTQTRTDRSTTYSDTSAQNKDKTYDTTHDTKVDRDPKSDSKKQASGKVDKEYADRVSKAAAVLQDLTASADKKIPNELLERAEAIAVIPHMMKGAFGIGGRYGKGVVSQRLENGRWSAPAFLEVGGGSFGAQLGVSATDLVLVFTDRKALSMLEGGKDLKLGVDAGVAAGPIGRSAEAGVNLNLESAIYAYSRSKGLFAGIALDGAVLDYDNSANEKVYGSSADAKDILGGRVSANATTRPFLDTLDKVMPKKRISQK
jgi:lipid-binding SYLF domain-containing protein